MGPPGYDLPVTDELNTHLTPGPAACPFVAFEDDRDHRSDAPDYRHRCFASAEPEPRAFPHQERYCLSAGFAGCPIFLDWARQEAAGLARDAAETEDGVVPDDVEAAPAFLASRPRSSVPGEPAASPVSRRAAEASANLWSNEGLTRRNAPAAPPPPSSVQVPQVAMARRGPTHPGWENPPRLENFPRLRSRDERASNAPLIGAVVVVAAIMVALVLLPVLLSGHGGTSQASPTSGSSASSALIADATPTATATPQAGPTPFLYTVTKKDKTLTLVAANHNVSVAMIIAYNGQLGPEFQIKNANVIWEGMQFYIPPPGWTPPPATPAPTASPTPTPTTTFVTP